jgi:hypothetical protein
MRSRCSRREVTAGRAAEMADRSSGSAPARAEVDDRREAALEQGRLAGPQRDSLTSTRRCRLRVSSSRPGPFRRTGTTLGGDWAPTSDTTADPARGREGEARRATGDAGDSRRSEPPRARAREADRRHIPRSARCVEPKPGRWSHNRCQRSRRLSGVWGTVQFGAPAVLDGP